MHAGRRALCSGYVHGDHCTVLLDQEAKLHFIKVRLVSAM
jgi:hypothetical protein